MAWADLLPQFPHLQIQSVQQECGHVTIRLVSTRQEGRCPTCQTRTQAGHGWFTRCIHSLPSSGQAVLLLIQARRFRCPNTACPRKTCARRSLSTCCSLPASDSSGDTTALQRGCHRWWPGWCASCRTDAAPRQSLHLASLSHPPR
jgi:transposase